MPRPPIFTFWNSLQAAWSGLGSAFREQRNFRKHLAIAAAVFGLALVLEISRIEWCLILVCFGMVLTVELYNTAIETLVDLVSPDFHRLAGKAKDIAAGAVLVASLATALIGGVIFIPRLWALSLGEL